MSPLPCGRGLLAVIRYLGGVGGPAGPLTAIVSGGFAAGAGSFSAVRLGLPSVASAELVSVMAESGKLSLHEGVAVSSFLS